MQLRTSNDAGAKGEWAQKAQNDTMHRPNNDATKGFHQTPNRYHQTARQRQRRLENGSA
jgi:hypothetical protein